ncbi:hypothetical protein [Hoeflea ulvae]|uniref:Ig-like domain-containing protein n=1 Tax=Hoeflea ulvae TaxID=2983764 RepID=A0ABT3YGP1_9HYPH|nr:hypothetical protein [Hoeflea ulvae]MCY0094905.1 hypothetical protein [Hoeflea ulvae]
MADTYNGILIRANGSDTGSIPRGGPFSGCPDIIPWGQTSVQDPQSTFGSASGSATSYNKDPGQNIQANSVNYIYVRGKNTGTAAVDGAQTYLWYSPSNLILWPQQWMTNQYMITPDKASVGTNYVPMSAATGAICVTPDPFIWLNPQPPASGTHYCLITMTGTNSEIVTMRDSAMSIVSSDGLGAWIAANGGTGWRNVATVTTGSPDFSTMTNYTNAGPVTKVHFTLLCTNLPAGSEVAFSCAAPNDGGAGFDPIALPWTKVPPPAGGKDGDTVASFSAGMQTQVIANYTSGFYYQYRSNGYKTPPGFNITMQALVVSNGKDALAAHPLTLASYVPESTMIFRPRENRLSQGLKFYADVDGGDPFDPPDNGNVTAAIIGSHTTQLPDHD